MALLKYKASTLCLGSQNHNRLAQLSTRHDNMTRLWLQYPGRAELEKKKYSSQVDLAQNGNQEHNPGIVKVVGTTLTVLPTEY